MLPLEILVPITVIFISIPVIVTQVIRRLGFVKTLEDFLVAKHLVPMSMVCATVTSLYIWGSSVMGSAEGAYGFGISGTWIYPMYSVGLWIFGLWASKLRALLPFAVTYIDWFKIRFKNAPLLLLVVIYALLTSLFGAMCQTTAAGHMYTGLSGGLPYAYQIGVLLGSVLSLIYVTTVGLWGSLIATWAFTILAMLFHAITASFAWYMLGGPGAVMDTAATVADQLGSEFFNLLSPSGLILYLPAVLAWALFSLPMQQDYWQVALAADSSKSAGRGFLHAGIWWFFMPFLATSLGFAYRILEVAGKVPHVAIGTEAYPTLISLFTPTWVQILFLYVILAAVVGTVGQALLAMGTVIANNIYKEFINKNATEKQVLRVARVSVVISAIVLILSTITPISTLYLLLFMPLYMAPLVGGFLLSMWRGWVSAWPMFAGGVIGFAVGAYMFLVQGLWGPSMVVAFIVGLGITALGSLIKKERFDFSVLEQYKRR
jgi:Na+/proline symporter